MWCSTRVLIYSINWNGFCTRVVLLIVSILKTKLHSRMHVFLQGWRSCAITTLGRGGSDLTATTIGKALGLREIQVFDGFSQDCIM